MHIIHDIRSIDIRNTIYAKHSICSLQRAQEDTEQINQADYLNVTSKRLSQIRQHTEGDEALQLLKEVVLRGWPDHREDTPLAIREYWSIRDEISAQDGVLFKSQRVIIPKSMRAEMLKRIHTSHVGGEACYRQAKDTLYWPNMHGEVRDYVSQCSTCNEYSHEQQRETMMSHALPRRPWQIVSMDLFRQAGKDFLLMVDHYSDFWEIELLPDLAAETTVLRCKAQFAQHGLPDRVITDGGPQFESETFRRFAKQWDFDHVMSSPRYPKANGKAESAVKIVKSQCKKANCAVAEALLEPRVVTGVPERLRVKHQTAKLWYDRSARDLPELSIGQDIRMKPLPGDRTGKWRRGVCLQLVGPRSYLVDVEGTHYRRNRVDLQPAEIGGTELRQEQ
uniref:Gypsy retrotransposon integrase-like protein 1 n=1 Tax=Nothobranchius rachovii TaxID=451742 RepID=A0A1A8Q4A2_9TELE